MTEVVNLRRARKARQRRTAVEVADRNRIMFGMSRMDRAAASAERSAHDRLLDNARLSDDDSPKKP